MTENIDRMAPDDILELFKTPEKVKAQGKCTFIRKIDELPDNIRKAVDMACENRDVTSREILAFINTKTDVKVNITSIQDHRHRDGCAVCLYGTPQT